MKIIFMGTSIFACEALEEIAKDNNFKIVAVYTKEPQISGRGKKIQKSAIHEVAIKYGLNVLTPKNLKEKFVQDQFRSFEADIAVVVSYGIILPQEILSSTKLGCINIHPSLLPRWRGAAPIQHTIMQGDKETAISIIKMDSGIDSGDIIYEKKIALDGTENYQEFSSKMSILGAKAVIESIKNLQNKNAVLTAQDHAKATYATKIKKEDCKINWNLSCEEIERKIRALNGYLEAFIEYDGEKIKIFHAKIIDNNSSKELAGKILNDKFFIQCKIGIIQPTILQRQGRNKIKIDDFLLGFKPVIGKILN